MTPYLAVPMHISIIRDDLMGFLHIHGLLPVSFPGKFLGESIHASHLFLPRQIRAGYRGDEFQFPIRRRFITSSANSVWRGKVVVTQFTVRVADN